MELDYTFMADTFVKIWGGIGTTLGLTVLSLAIAFPIAFYMAILRVRGHVIGSAVTGAYISFVRGTPIIYKYCCCTACFRAFLMSSSRPLALILTYLKKSTLSGMLSSFSH